MASFSKAYLNQLLTNISIAYMTDANDFIASKVAPFLKVEKDTGEIFNYGKQALRITEDARAIGGAYNKVRFDVQKNSHYQLKDYGYIGEVYEEDVENADQPLNPETDETEMLTNKLLLAMEKRLAGGITTTSITNNITLTGTSKWSDYSGVSNPFTVIANAVDGIHKRTGKIANSMVISWDTLIALKNHPQVIARFKNVDVITEKLVRDMLASMFGFENIYIGAARENAANSDVDATNLSLIWNNMCLVYYSEKTPRQRSTTFAKTYSKRDGIEVVKLPQDKLATDALERRVYSMIRVSAKYDQVIVDQSCAYLIVGTVS